MNMQSCTYVTHAKCEPILYQKQSFMGKGIVKILLLIVTPGIWQWAFKIFRFWEHEIHCNHLRKAHMKKSSFGTIKKKKNTPYSEVASYLFLRDFLFQKSSYEKI